MLTKKDIFSAFIIGLLVPLMALAVLKNLFIKLPIDKNIILIAGPVLSVIGIYVAAFIARIWRPFVFQFAKFFLVGTLNTLIDFGVLNFLIYTTGIAEGYTASLFKGVSFIVAVVNSYFWNKNWTFQSNKDTFKSFFLVTLGGFLINTGIFSYIIKYVEKPENLSIQVWDNIAALCSIVFVLTWNFLWQKFFVFKKNK